MEDEEIRREGGWDKYCKRWGIKCWLPLCEMGANENEGERETERKRGGNTESIKEGEYCKNSGL